MTPFKMVLSFAAGVLVLLVVVGGSIYAYNNFAPTSLKTSVEAELAATRAEVARLRGAPAVVDPAAAELARLRQELAALKAGTPTATAPAATPTATSPTAPVKGASKSWRAISTCFANLGGLGLKEGADFWTDGSEGRGNAVFRKGLRDELTSKGLIPKAHECLNAA